MPEHSTAIYRRRGFWFALWVVASFPILQEIGDALHGPRWAVYVASICILAVWVALTYALAKWADAGPKRRG